MEISVAVVSPPGYPHSTAFAEVAETVRHGLSALGHDALVCRNPSAPDRRHIVLGAHLAPGAGIQLPPGSVIYNLEQVDSQSRWMTGELLELYRRFPLWDYSAANIERLVAMGQPRPTHVPIGYAPTLTRIAPVGPDIDVLFYGSMNERRKRIIDRLRAAGARVEAVFGVYGDARDTLIARAKGGAERSLLRGQSVRGGARLVPAGQRTRGNLRTGQRRGRGGSLRFGRGLRRL